jgi:hypothetical protein
MSEAMSKLEAAAIVEVLMASVTGTWNWQQALRMGLSDREITEFRDLLAAQIKEACSAGKSRAA